VYGVGLVAASGAEEADGSVSRLKPDHLAYYT